MFAHQYNTIQYNTIQLKFDIALLTELRSAHTPYEMAQCSCTAEQLRVKDLPKVLIHDGLGWGSNPLRTRRWAMSFTTAPSVCDDLEMDLTSLSGTSRSESSSDRFPPLGQSTIKQPE